MRLWYFVPSLVHPVFGQSLGNAGTIEGTVVDPSGAAVAKATVTIHNAVTGYKQSTITGADGAFRFSNIPPNPYHLEVNASGFAVFGQDVSIRSAIPIQVKATLALAGAQTTVTVEGAGADLIEVDPSAHIDADRTLIMKIPSVDPAGGLSQAITYSTGGVAADGNGLFHPLGDHAQSSFVIDGQPISDQQSKVFSTQLPTSAIQSMEVVTGTPDAEFGDKSSLVANITTRSGLGSGGSSAMSTPLTARSAPPADRWGSASEMPRSATSWRWKASAAAASWILRNSPPFHDIGNSQTIFDRFDYQPNGQNVFHLNLFAARNWIQIPNTYDTLGQDQRQRVLTWSLAPGFQHTFNAHTPVDHQSVHPQGPVQLLRQPRSLRRHALHAEPGIASS